MADETDPGEQAPLERLMEELGLFEVTGLSYEEMQEVVGEAEKNFRDTSLSDDTRVCYGEAAVILMQKIMARRMLDRFTGKGNPQQDTEMFQKAEEITRRTELDPIGESRRLMESIFGDEEGEALAAEVHLMFWLARDERLRAEALSDLDPENPSDDSVAVLLADVLYQDGAVYYQVDTELAAEVHKKVPREDFDNVSWPEINAWVLNFEP